MQMTLFGESAKIKQLEEELVDLQRYVARLHTFLCELEDLILTEEE